MKLIIAGCKSFGKDKACALISDKFTSASSSWIACKHFLFDQLKDKYGYQTPEECHADRNNHRQEWYEAIREFNAEDRTRLAKLIFQEVDIYNGIRDLEELNAIKEAGLVDFVIWLDRSTVQPWESETSMNVRPEHCDIILDNNRELKHLRILLLELLFCLKDPKFNRPYVMEMLKINDKTFGTNGSKIIIDREGVTVNTYSVWKNKQYPSTTT